MKKQEVYLAIGPDSRAFSWSYDREEAESNIINGFNADSCQVVAVSIKEAEEFFAENPNGFLFGFQAHAFPWPEA